MKETRYTWQAEESGPFFAREWKKKGAIRGTLCLVHGLGEHSGRYQHVASHLTSEGLVVFALDLQGHGRTEGRRGHILSYPSLLTDIQHLLYQAKTRYPQQPLFLYGHSLGGNLVLNFVLFRKETLTGVIASSPWLVLTVSPPSWKILLGKMMNRFWPSFIQQNTITSETLSHDTQVQTAYINDPLVHNKISARLFCSVYEKGSWALENAASCNKPLLLLHGTEDRLTSWKASQLFSQRAPDCTFKSWKGLYHELHNEKEKDSVLNTITSWIEKRLT